MPPESYAWLATLALIAARNARRTRSPLEQDDDPDSSRPVVSQVTAVAGFLTIAVGEASNEPGLVLFFLCQNLRTTVQSVTGIAIFCRSLAAPAKASNPSARAASRALPIALVLCQFDHSPTAPDAARAERTTRARPGPQKQKGPST